MSNAPYKQRILRLRKRLEPGANVEEGIRRVDRERTEYLHICRNTAASAGPTCIYTT